MQADIQAAADGLEKFMVLDDQIAALYRTGAPADKAKAVNLDVTADTEIYTAAAERLKNLSDGTGEEQAADVAAAAASGRVLVSRTAHNHRSMRVDSINPSWTRLRRRRGS